MADNKALRGSPDSKRLNKSEDYEVRYAKERAASAAAKMLARKAALGAS